MFNFSFILIIFTRHCEGEARSNPDLFIFWIASPQAARNDESVIFSF